VPVDEFERPTTAARDAGQWIVGNVHVQAVTPAEADAVRAVIDRSVASMRFGEVAAST